VTVPPETTGGLLDHVEPLLVSTLPFVPGVVNPVPPAAAGNVPAVTAELDVE
jgi:hypothetical protein